ncbi:MAG: hypothetical protein F6K28_08505 [Microcoleus sp. SIO2G3]|nr:hypothetical protein [Microcoleus sp. SIO2G3]
MGRFHAYLFERKGQFHLDTNPAVCAYVVRRFNASPQRVFDICLDPQTLWKWLW